ncbi:DUF4126 domain-containing protein [Verrucomicrobium sp. BvORR106]|uniref:DUF4126 domain-containing protein n=1 Tax=Verrucomicrobium sp. BvORR106 TaxID=1403819 RepID=UPI0006924FEB|nr:DUF4126 domain-containing protein [Verrucomicrobium sp. BvORR106]
MHILEQLGVALGLASLAGVNLYLTVLLAGLAVRFDWLHLAAQHQSLEVLGHPVVLFVAGLLFCLEFFADKVPWVDSLWDSVHTFIRPVGGVLLGLEAVGDMPLYVKVTAALLAGGAALTTHGAKAGTRLIVNQSPEPVSNVAVSVSEDVAVAGGVALTLLNPMVALITFGGILIILWMLLPRLWRASKAAVWLVWKKLRMPGMRRALTQPLELERRVNDDLRDLLQLQVGIDENDVLATVRCLSGKGRGVRGLSSNLPGLLVLTRQKDHLYFAASKGLSDRVFRLPLEGVEIQTDSRFLSENLVLEGAAYRAVFRFPRGEGDVVETLALRLQGAPLPQDKGVEAPVVSGGKQVRIKPGTGQLPPVDLDSPTSPMLRPIPAPSGVAEVAAPSAPIPAPDLVKVPDSKAPESVSLKPLVLPRPSVSSEVVLRPLDDPPAISEIQADLPIPTESSSAEADKPTAGTEPKKESLPAFPALP